MRLGKIVCCFLFLFRFGYLTGNEKFQLANISIKDGLSNMNVNAITQDQLGYTWIATMRGLNRYNGYEFRHFFFDPNDSNSLRSNHIFSLFTDDAGRIYIGTMTGIDYYDIRSEKIISPFPDFNKTVMVFEEAGEYVYVGTVNGFYRFRPGSNKIENIDNGELSPLYISSLYNDGNGNIWCGLDNGGGLAAYNIKSGRFDHFLNTTGRERLNCNTIRSIFRASENLLILGTKNGIHFFDLKRRHFVEPAGFMKLAKIVEESDVRFILEKEPSVYWIGTYQAGLFTFNKLQNTVSRHADEQTGPVRQSNSYLCHYTDKTGNIWLGTFNTGLDVHFNQSLNFNFDVPLNKLTQGKFITGIRKDKQNRFIIGTRESGFIIYDPFHEHNETLNPDNSELEFPYIRTIFVDSENKYWIGHHYGLQVFDPVKRVFAKINVPEPNNGVVSIVQVGNRIIAGTDRQGLLAFDLQGKLKQQFLEYGQNIPRIIILNEKELFFVSYMDGLFILNTEDLSAGRLDFPDFKHQPGINFAVTAIKDKEGKIWLGTYNYGLFSLDPGKKEIRNYNVREGLPSSDVVGIEEDDNNNLWLSTSFGLARLDKSNNSIKTYFFNEGVNNYQFHEKASFRDEKGIIYFGGNSGLTYFDPKEIQMVVNHKPGIILEDLYIHNVMVKPDEKGGILGESLPFTKEITLTHREQLFSISFVALDYLSPEKMQYYYILEGFDKDWYSIGNQRRASYSNLPRGKYVFKVKSVGSGGVMSENEAELTIRVRPAPWFTWWAWACYAGIVAAVMLFIFRLRIKAFIYKKNLEIEHSEHLREREINQMKQKFFANISHELRTPLTLIYGLVNQLSAQDKLSPKVREFVKTLDLNVNRLLKLINQLLAFRKLESESLSLWLEKGNLNEAVQKILELFNVYAKEKNIRIEFHENNTYPIWFDYDKLEKILSNLLSNAIKHSREGSRIVVSVTKTGYEPIRHLYKNVIIDPSAEYIEISVTDFGHGIGEKEWDTIFDRYKQVEAEGKLLPDYSGTGIGLNFTKTLVEIHKGRIRMESKPGFGTTFSFILPVDHLVFDQNDFAEAKELKEQELPVGGSGDLNRQEENVVVCPDFDKTILLVEDDPQLNSFLAGVLKGCYRVITAHDGEKGLKLVRQEHPDLVISDVMMPKKDGFELTREIKENRELCHIPVILLTAKTEVSHQIEGMHSGADLYIAKPFNTDFLISAVDSQLKNRRRIQEIFLNGRMPSLERPEINQLDIQFLSKLNALLERELANPDLDIQLLALNLNLSRSVFYRKFMSLTRLSPVSYIRKFRINKSIELMYAGRYSLSEISELTGFRSPSYFSTAFKQEKGMGPREFLNQDKNTPKSDNLFSKGATDDLQ